MHTKLWIFEKSDRITQRLGICFTLYTLAQNVVMYLYYYH